MARRGRQPTEEERALWRQVADTVAPHADRPAPHVPLPETAPPLVVVHPRPVRTPKIFKPTGSSTGPSLTLPETGSAPASGLDRRTEERLKKGRRSPDARLDLHGMSAARAHRVLITFISDARAQGHRCVLVITGKGGPGEREPFAPEAPGVLRREAPMWLSSPPLAQMIVNVSQAHPRHGGGGALYVYLKRIR